MGCRIKADHELEDKKRIPMSIVFVVWWCLYVLGRTDFSPSSDEQMTPTDITQDMRVLSFYINEAATFGAAARPQ